MNFFYDEVESNLFETLYILFMYLFVYLAMITNSVFSYVSDNKKALAISYMCGIPRKVRYRNLVLMNLVAYVLPLIISTLFLGVSLCNALMFCAFFAGVELMIELIMLKVYERKGVVTSLKGGGF